MVSTRWLMVFAFEPHTFSSLFTPWAWEVSPGLGPSRGTMRFLCVDTHGISQVPDQSILYLCPVLRPRSDRICLAFSAYPVLPPLMTQKRLQHSVDVEALSHGFNIHCLRFTNAVTDAHARLVSSWWLVFARRESNPLDCSERFPNIILFFLLSQAWPVASHALLQQKSFLLRRVYRNSL